ncbi:triose-phosphate isomerase [Candidatus Falkowbacteria bacterium]|uniref:Triosephosphate isomerase n=1 Tax=Candidatus Buchananbacteria bacterium CG10_big_fil_rev_8_21_14_0_10_33_19 TaxID=1974525 RepID=A0A2H0W547_9BACT|nr:triose-phosphate isomerase [Candidatus Falkowbacteria bacterium]PIS05760.1 MAG: triose-phosphate isomerase [Candidatus Buchananbacteria bacterium CG10_big_fil_rev_8_21_14_0_10_33_19]
MKKPIVIANWKMKLSAKQSSFLAKDFKKSLKNFKDQDIVVCPSDISLTDVGSILKKSNIKLGAQNMFWEEFGAYTGESSSAVLKEVGCDYVILGHSERRQYLGETNDMVNKKIDRALDSNLVPIICIGETKDERHDGLTDNVLYHQLKECLNSVHLIVGEKIIVAYEPVWAIGSGDVVDADEAERVFELINQVLIDIYPLTIVRNNVRMIYGGGIDSSNISSFSDIKLLDGFLVGGASLDTNKFKDIITAL